MVYAPPNATADYHRDLNNYLTTTSTLSTSVFILGDFNLPDINWDTLTGISTISNNFCDCIFESNLTQLVESPTHQCGNILDLVLTNSPEHVLHLSVHPREYQCITSDHHLITFTTNFKSSSHSPTSKEFFNLPKVTISV